MNYYTANAEIILYTCYSHFRRKFQMKLLWSFILKNWEFLDCQIILQSGIFWTNKCFLAGSDFLWSIVKDQTLEKHELIMPHHTEEELRSELNGFVISIKSNKSLKESVSCAIKLDQSISLDTESNQAVLSNTQNNINGRKKVMKCKPRRVSGQPLPQRLGLNWQCEKCGRSFDKSKQLKMHRYQVHVEKEYYHHCSECKGKFKTRSILINHLKTHEPPAFSCPSCSRKFKKKFNLERHSLVCRLKNV